MVAMTSSGIYLSPHSVQESAMVLSKFLGT